MTTTISGSNGIVFPDATSMQTGQQAVKAWVNFDGTGVVAIRAGYNVASITDNGTGDQTVNFTTAIVDANYSFVASGGNISSNANVSTNAMTAPSTTSCRLRSFTSTGSAYLDVGYVSVAIFR